MCLINMHSFNETCQTFPGLFALEKSGKLENQRDLIKLKIENLVIGYKDSTWKTKTILSSQQFVPVDWSFVEYTMI